MATFYGPQPARGHGAEVKQAYNRAWLHHQHLGPHHWQHWLLRQDDGQLFGLPMPKHFIREMVADWIGAGKALNKPDMEAWFFANKSNIVLEDGTYYIVTQLIQEAKRKGLIP